ncbi:SDR family NAD(P)-dependent oxidoreductase [Streptomyces silvisoli]|uniref:SDR family oxidoreductase n=1 Tax=Streptomyces silvisoli TaxID=3034235 RepID=A0ABT5ZEH1_9ACTN|nr:SDR family oxidoreductase [Streptomyces silvisoli]MDF3287964.1 SDR family oxidoreductase [Streptomyces silvisoli]
MTTSIVVGGSGGLGRVLAQRFADRGDTVIITSRTSARAESVAAEIAGTVRGLALDLSRPQTIDGALADVREVDNLVISAVAELFTTVADFDITKAVDLVTIKLVGYTETVRVLRDRFTPGASVVLFGGLAKERPYPGSTMVSASNAGITGLMKTLAVEIAPHRVNAIHPGVVGDHPRWRDTPDHPHVSRTPIGRLVTMAEVADAADFLLRNTGVNAQELFVDGGVRIT